jgi:outer membrane lipoprotein SlyB
MALSKIPHMFRYSFRVDDTVDGTEYGPAADDVVQTLVGGKLWSRPAAGSGAITGGLVDLNYGFLEGVKPKDVLPDWPLTKWPHWKITSLMGRFPGATWIRVYAVDFTDPFYSTNATPGFVSKEVSPSAEQTEWGGSGVEILLREVESDQILIFDNQDEMHVPSGWKLKVVASDGATAVALTGAGVLEISVSPVVSS